MPQGPLQAQFGPEGKRIWELARGYDNTPLYPKRSEEVIEESITLPSMATTLEAVLFAVEALLVRVFARDNLKGSAIRSLVIWAQVEGLCHVLDRTIVPIMQIPCVLHVRRQLYRRSPVTVTRFQYSCT